MTLTDTFKSVRRAAGTLADMTDDERNAVLADVADAIVAGKERLLAGPTWPAWTRPTRSTTGSG